MQVTSPNEKIRNIFVSLFGSVDVVAQAHHEQNCAELYALWRVDRNVKVTLLLLSKGS